LEPAANAAHAPKRTGGRWNPREGNIYFVASNADSLERVAAHYDYFLIAVNELQESGKGRKDLARVEAWCTGGKSVFLDSGVFNLATVHAKAHGLSMDKALGLPPEEVDGFDHLYMRYVRIAKRLEHKVWGFVEIDQGGAKNKRRTRARLEAEGLIPIPVYHPFNDGWDYFDELASQYDRICFGNVVMADQETRKRLLATAWERRKKYPHLWIHLLGLTPNEALNAYPINSCDSSTWLNHVRWSNGAKTRVALRPFSLMPDNFRYQYGADAKARNGYDKACQFGAVEAHMVMRNWRGFRAERDAVLPEPS
jgi:hypothetical protein